MGESNCDARLLDPTLEEDDEPLAGYDVQQEAPRRGRPGTDSLLKFP